MTEQAKVIALIPAYNPDRKMLGVVSDLKDCGYTVVIVNDGSDAEFDDLFRAAGRADHIIRYTPNQGKGVALKTGLRFIAEHFEAPYTVVTVDADGQHKIDDTQNVVRAAQEHTDSLIIGSRHLRKGAPFRSKSGNFITRVFLHALTPVTIYDTQSGLRACSDKLVPFLAGIEGERYEYEMRMLIDTQRAGYPLREVPIAAVYIDNNSTSHFRTVADSVRLYKVIFKNAGKK